MPLYEYYCRPCDGIFEMLRPAREASKAQPCPVCDEDGERLMPTTVQAFTMRDGYPRRIPDDGKHWHLGRKVNEPIRGPVRPNEHPEINKPRPDPVPTAEEIDRFEYAMQQKREQRQAEIETMGSTVRRPNEEAQERKFRKRLAQVKKPTRISLASAKPAKPKKQDGGRPGLGKVEHYS